MSTPEADQDAFAQYVLENPECFLWVRSAAGSLTTIAQGRLYELLAGNAPSDGTERLLADNPSWVRQYLGYGLGNYVIEIPQGGPLPVLLFPEDER